jgi:hypothetical protein
MSISLRQKEPREMKYLPLTLTIAALFLGQANAALSADIAVLCANSCRIEKVSNGFYKATPLKKEQGARKIGHFLIEEVDMRGLGASGTNSSVLTEKSESILTKSLWERQHEAYERLREKGELLTPKDPPPPPPKSGQ